MLVTSKPQTTYLVIGLAAIGAAAALWYISSQKGGGGKSAAKKSKFLPAKKDADGVGSPASDDSGITPTKSNVQRASAAGSAASTASTTASSAVSSAKSSADDDNKILHSRIEEIDRAGKALFKAKKFMEAADKFTEALELIEQRKSASSADGGDGKSSSLARQIITLTNNRSAMYEKASHLDLALSDCDVVLDLDPAHTKARTRRLRILESQKRYPEALVEVCALQLKYMNDNRPKLMLGLQPAGNPPVSQAKVEELVTLIQPYEVRRAQEASAGGGARNRALPSTYTVAQLLKSFSGYNKWMGQAARTGKLEKFTNQLDDLLDHIPRKNMEAFADNVATKATLLLHRGRRHAYDKDFKKAVKDFDEAFALVEDNDGTDEPNHEEVKKEIVKAMDTDDYARLLEWAGMCKHLRYELKGALECYERCSALEPENTELLVKRAGVKMDGTQHANAERLFDEALSLDPVAADALLHRANLRMLQQRVSDSEADLRTCLRLHPNNLLARLRLATVYMAKEDMDAASQMLDEAEGYDPDSSEVHCYRGELHFARGDFAGAREEFEKAMECDPDNPTPYVNASLALANTPPVPGQRPDLTPAIELLEKAIEVDPMFHAAYVQLGQMKLAQATDLKKAKEVVELYDRGLEYCRTPEELKDICSMRILTVAQIDAAHALHMETLHMQ